MTKTIKFIIITICSAMIIALIISPETYMQTVSEGLSMFITNILPSMLPFFFFSKLLTSMGAGETLGKMLEKPIKFMFNSHPTGGYVFIISLLSGYPIGAKTVSELFTNGIINQNEAKTMLSYTSTSGPLFVLGTIGIKLIGNYKYGIIILSSHILGTIINGIIFRPKNTTQNKKTNKTYKAVKVDNVLYDTINSSIGSLLSVGLLIIVFNMLILFLSNIGIFDIFGEILAKFNIENHLATGIISGIIEVTKGSMIIANSGASPYIIIPTIATLVSFGGLSVAIQSMMFLSGANIKIGYYLLTKTSQCIATFVIAVLLCIIII